MNSFSKSRDCSRLFRPAAAGRVWIEETAIIPVRFQEVDSMQVVWHGHYVTYLEEARRAFGRRHGLDYTVFQEHGVGAPVVELSLNYLGPARVADTLAVTARFFKNDAPKLEFEYAICRQGDTTLLAMGRSLQVFVDGRGELILQTPSFLVDCYRRWENLWRSV